MCRKAPLSGTLPARDAQRDSVRSLRVSATRFIEGTRKPFSYHVVLSFVKVEAMIIHSNCAEGKHGTPTQMCQIVGIPAALRSNALMAVNP